ncbi:hypothetical protein [Hymenobacter terrenus]|uniref:hypothetical protein n=1 Tax=Hymenobacter terrenus TaxID=1629124 RepID=UPI000619CD78|nr:hypothetical protein [Hymenobacter terrenus]
MSPTPELPEPGRPNLRRAIHSLPVHEPDAALWLRIATQLAAEQAIAHAVAQLPTHEPDQELWSRITTQLTLESVADQPLTSWPALPTYEPDDAVWDTIAARLDAPTIAAEPNQLPQRSVVRQLWPVAAAPRRLMALAASLLLLVSLVWWQRPTSSTNGPRETVSYTQEIVTEAVPTALAPAPDPLEAEGRAFIDSKCSTLPAVCQSGDFQSLRGQLDELETEEQRLLRDSQRFGNSPELVRHQVRVATLKATVTRELIRLLIS